MSASAVEQIAAGAFVNAADKALDGPWVENLASRGQTLIDGLEDDALKAGLSAALGELTTPQATALLTQTAQHQVQAFAIRLQLGQRAEARAIFIGQSDFNTRHRLIKSDNQALVQSTDEHIKFVDALESLLVSAATKGGAAFVPFLLSAL